MVPAQVSHLKAALSSLEASERDGVGRSLKRARLECAAESFRLAQSETLSVSERLMAYTRQMQSHVSIIQLFMQGDLTEQDIREVIYWTQQLLDSLESQKISKISLSTASRYLEEVIVLLSSARNRKDQQTSLRLLRAVVDRIRLSQVRTDRSIIPVRLEASLSVFTNVFHAALKFYDEGLWMKAKGLLDGEEAALNAIVELESDYETSMTTEEQGAYAMAGYEERRAHITQVEYQTYTLMCAGSQWLHTGDVHFQAAMAGDPDELYGRMQLAQDDYRAALRLVEGQDIELEGRALFCIARFYSKVAKIPSTAHDLYLRAVQLAATLAPAQPKGTWYIEATNAIQARRDELEAEEAKQWHRRREPIIAELVEELAKLGDKRDIGNKEFCQFLYKEFPPKTPGSLDVPDEEPTKRFMVKIIARYHTDKNLQWGDKWRVLSEEICQALTGRYNVMKGAD